MLSLWWVGMVYAVHHNCKGHTGAGMSFGQGMAMSYSWKQKVLSKSLIEAELIGVDDTQATSYGPDTSWKNKDMIWTHLSCIRIT